MSSGDEADDLNEDDFLTALNSNNNSPPFDEQLAKLSNMDDGLGPLPVIKKKSSSRTPSRRTSRDSIQYIFRIFT